MSSYYIIGGVSFHLRCFPSPVSILRGSISTTADGQTTTSTTPDPHEVWTWSSLDKNTQNRLRPGRRGRASFFLFDFGSSLSSSLCPASLPVRRFLLKNGEWAAHRWSVWALAVRLLPPASFHRRRVSSPLCSSVIGQFGCVFHPPC